MLAAVGIGFAPLDGSKELDPLSPASYRGAIALHKEVGASRKPQL